LKRHKVTHTTCERRHQCIRCSQSFSRFANRRRHMHSLHGSDTYINLESVPPTLEDYLDDSTSSRGVVTPLLDEVPGMSNQTMETATSLSSPDNNGNSSVRYECVSPDNQQNLFVDRATATATVGERNVRGGGQRAADSWARASPLHQRRNHRDANLVRRRGGYHTVCDSQTII
jgi:hypothetical protein